MDAEIFTCGSRRLKVSIAGIDPNGGSIAAETFRLAIYAFEDEPMVRPIFTAELNVEQASRLHSYLDSISVVKDASIPVSGRFFELRDDVDQSVLKSILSSAELLSNPMLIRAALNQNPDLTRAILETELHAYDVQSLAYRRDQLERMGRLLADDDFFEDQKHQAGVHGPEAVWQAFFESNQWIFGYGLNYIIGEGVDSSKLEQVVAGHSIARAGKRVDALLRTRGLLRSMCYVEIKTHKTQLMHTSEYRSEVWRPSAELVGGVAQSQKTVQLAVDALRSETRVPAGGGAAGKHLFNISPRSVLVCGSLAEFSEDGGVNEPKFSSFELFRRSLQSPDVITFDELHERASSIVEAGIAARTNSE